MRRGRRLPTVVPTDSRPLSWPPIGALPRNRLASSATGGASPISPTTRLHRAPLLRRRHAPRSQNPVSLRTSAHTGVAIRTPPRTAPYKGHGLPRRCAPRNDIFVKIIPLCVGVGDCPPSCQPIPVHCRGSQSGHFLEIGSLLPPPAALRRFPRRPACIAPPCPAAATTHRALKTPCHCEPVRTLVWQSVLPRTAPHKGNGLPRRCAPRNDIFLVGAKHVGRAGQSRRPYAHFIRSSVGRGDHTPPPFLHRTSRYA